MVVRLLLAGFLLAWCAWAGACSDDDDETEADRLGVGAECDRDDHCEHGQQCLHGFKGGYCGMADCTADPASECPHDEVCCPHSSVCVSHEDGSNYCFRVCGDKDECNANRDGDNESNCSANITTLDEGYEGKACVPPSGN